MAQAKEKEQIDNLSLWKAVEKTNPEYTKKANVKGNSITSIAPQYQIKQATEKFGAYGSAWGFKNISVDFELVPSTGLVYWRATFYYPGGDFPATNTISIYKDNARTKPDDQFAKKVETDSLTKCLSKLGFNADVFLGKFDDVRYIEEMKEEFETPEQKAAKIKAEEERLKAEEERLKAIEDAKPKLNKETFDKIIVMERADWISSYMLKYKMSKTSRTKLEARIKELNPNK